MDLLSLPRLFRLTTWLCFTLTLEACGPERRLVLGDAPDAAHDGSEGEDSGELGGDDHGEFDAGGSLLLVSFRAPTILTGNVVLLTCAEECVEAEVVIEGGTPPYEIRWADGATGAKREVCAGVGSYGVSVEDSGDPNGEFGAPRLSAEATLSVQRGACTDGGVARPCRVVTTASASSCSAEDSYLDLGVTLQAGRRYEFRYDLTLIGVGSFGVYASDAQCVGVGPELARVEFAEGLVIGGAKRTTYSCQTLTQDAALLFLDQSPKVWGGADFATVTVCDGCPSEGE